MAQKKNARGHTKKGRYSSSSKAYSYATRPLKLNKDVFSYAFLAH